MKRARRKHTQCDEAMESSTEYPPPPTLTSPFEEAVQPKEDHHSILSSLSSPHRAPHLPHPHLFHKSTEEHQFVAETNDVPHVAASTAVETEQSTGTEHPQLTRARQKAKSNFINSPLLQDEYIFPRFSVHELKLGRVLGRGGFGTVLAVERFEIESGKPSRHRRGLSGGFSSSIFRHSKLNDDAGSREVRLVKSMDALGEMKEPPVKDVEAVALEESKPKRKRRSVSLGFGQRHDFFRRGKRGGGDEAQSDKENQQQQSDQKQFQKHQQSSKEDRGICDQEKKENVLADTAVTAAETLNDSLIAQRPSLESTKQRPSLNFSFVSWRDSTPGQEGKDAIDESDLRFLKWVEEDDAHHVHVPKSIDESDELPSQEEKKVQDNEEKDKAQADTPVKSDSPTNNQNNASPPSPKRRVILFSNNHNTNTSFDLNSSLRPNILQDKQFLSQHVTTSKGKSRYVVKIISPHIVRGDFQRFLQAAADMATETYFFSVLNHPHILKMRAVGQGDFFSPSYFLVLDRLYDTLSDRIEGTWKKQCHHLENDFFVWNRHRKGRGLWEERVGVARDLAGALAYLHDMGIIYRDLKPDNVGFDSKRVAKLFDFGLAKQVRLEDANDDGTWRLTANTGSLRYMATEVGNGWPYNFKADAYSFSMLLWEMLSLELPFAHYTAKEIVNMVRKWGERPKLKDEWSSRIKENLVKGWDSNHRKRPSMKDFETVLELELHESYAA